MEYDAKKEERKVFFHYFRVWFILLAIAVVAFIVVFLTHKKEGETTRQNTKAPTQRVYDYADVLTQKEEEYLAEQIAKCEEQAKCDIILVTIDQEMGLDDSTWTHNMVNYADDFYDDRAFGYDAPYGDGALFLDNWYKDEYGSQQGAWLSTSGKVESIIGSHEEDRVWDAFDAGLRSNAATGYEYAIREIARQVELAEGKGYDTLPWLTIWVVPLVIALIYAFAKMHQKPGVDTTTPLTYVPGKQPHVLRREDTFLRKSVSKVKIETESSGSRGGGGGGGSYGHHTSSGGHSHGGGGHRR